MIPHGMEVYVALDPIDLRWGFDRLAGVVTERLGRGRAAEERCSYSSGGGAPH